MAWLVLGILSLKYKNMGKRGILKSVMRFLYKYKFYNSTKLSKHKSKK